MNVIGYTLTEKRDSRIAFIDLAKCLCMFLVFMGHSGVQGLPRAIIYSFHVPLFILISGCFAHDDYSQFGILVKKNVKQLLIPYFFFYILTIPFGLVNIHIHGTPISPDYIWKPIVGMLWGVYHFIGENSYYTNGPLWFLLSLFWCRLIFYINKIHRYSLSGIIIGTLICLTIGSILIYLNINFWSLSQGLLLYPFFCIGYILNRRTDIISTIDKLQMSKSILLCFIFVIIVTIGNLYIGDIDYACNRTGNYFISSFIVSFAGCVMFLLLSKILNYRIIYKTRALQVIGGGVRSYI